MFCPAIYDPLCGTDDTTYSSKCILRQHNCQTLAGLEEEGRGSEFVEIGVAARGECPTLPFYMESEVNKYLYWQSVKVCEYAQQIVM